MTKINIILSLTRSRACGAQPESSLPRLMLLPRQPAVVDAMAELAAAVPELLRPEQAAQYYAEAVQIAVAACAEDTVDQRCYICLDAVKPDTNEGLVRGCSCRGGAGFAHVSCLARQAQAAVQSGAWKRWHTCRQCEQQYHGVVYCALGWACWKTYLGRPETSKNRRMAMTELGLGLSAARREEDALTVGEAELAMLRRLRASEESILVVQNNLANSYQKLGRLEMVLPLRQEVYSGRLRLDGDENEKTLRAAYNYAASLLEAKRIAEAKTLLREVIPVARRVLGEGNRLALKMRSLYAKALYNDPGATLDDLREAATTLEDTERIARRVLGSAHPLF